MQTTVTIVMTVLSIVVLTQIGMTQTQSMQPGDQNGLSSGTQPLTQISDLKNFWALIQLGGGIAYTTIFVFALGIFLISVQIYELVRDRLRGRVLLAIDYRQHTVTEVTGMVKKYHNTLTGRLYSILLSIFHSTGAAQDFHDEITNYIQKQQERFNTFKGRLAFLSDTAGALGLLGTVWGMFVTFFGGNLDSQRILNGMGIALVTTIVGLVVSIILNFCSTEVFSIFNKRMELISSKADEFRLWLMAIIQQKAKRANDIVPASGENATRNQTQSTGRTSVAAQTAF
ncbi:MAG TPA: MotA/TolQ/ExbB proton channel family protein [bacterium]